MVGWFIVYWCFQWSRICNSTVYAPPQGKDSDSWKYLIVLPTKDNFKDESFTDTGGHRTYVYGRDVGRTRVGIWSN